MTVATKDARLDLRMTAAQKATVEEAARLAGSTLAGYATTRLVESAENDIARNRAILVSQSDWDTLVGLLDQPDGPKWQALRTRQPQWSNN